MVGAVHDVADIRRCAKRETMFSGALGTRGAGIVERGQGDRVVDFDSLDDLAGQIGSDAGDEIGGMNKEPINERAYG
jgi:hypothetical protein